MYCDQASEPDEMFPVVSNIDELEERIVVRNIPQRLLEDYDFAQFKDIDWSEQSATSPDELRSKVKDDSVELLKEYLENKSDSLKQRALQYAMEDNQIETVKCLIEYLDEYILLKKYDLVRNEGIIEKSLLQYITESNDKEMAKCFLDKFPNENRPEIILQEVLMNIPGKLFRTTTCYHLAAYLGLSELTNFYKSQGITVDSKTLMEETALMWATRGDQKSLIEELISMGACPFLKNINGCTALRWAVRYGHIECVNILLKYFTNEHQSDLISSLNLASAFGYSKIVEAIIASSLIDVNTPDCYQLYPIHYAANKGHEDVLRLLIQNKADLNVTNAKGDTALFLAIQNDQVHIVRMLIEYGCNVYLKNMEGKDIWSFALLKRNKACFQGLIHIIAEKITQGSTEMKMLFNTRSPVFEIAKNGDLSGLEILEKRKLDMKIKDEGGNTILHIAAQGKHHDIVERFKDPNFLNEQNNNEETAFHLAASTGNFETINAFLKLGAKANIKNCNGETILHIAAKSKSTSAEVMKLLVNYMMNRHSWDNLNDIDKEGRNALHVAALYGSPDVIWECRSLTCNTSDMNGDTPYHLAIRAGQPEIFQKMLDIYDFKMNKADLNKRNKEGETVVFKVIEKRFLCCFKRLLQHNIDLTFKYKEKENTVLHDLVKICIRNSECLEFFDILHDHFTSKNNLKFSSKDFRKLIFEVKNKKQLSVFSLAFIKCAKDIINKLMTLKYVTQFDIDDCKYFDVTQILLNNDIRFKNIKKDSDTSMPSSSAFEIFLSMETKPSLGELFTILPLKHIAVVYKEMNQVLCAAAMLVHFSHMLLLTVNANQLVKYKVDEVKNINLNLIVICSLCEPVVILIFCLISLFRSTCNYLGYKGRDEDPEEDDENHHQHNKLYLGADIDKNSCQYKLKKFTKYVRKKFLLTIIMSIYSVLSIAWIIQRCTNNPDYYICLGVVLCYGWLLGITFIRGLKPLHYFWRVLSEMLERDILRFFCMYTCVLLAFSLSFHIWLNGSGNLKDENPWLTIFALFNLMLGMGEIFDFSLQDALNEGSSLTHMYKALYCLYFLIGIIIFINLLTAMLNDTYSVIKSKNELNWQIDSIKQAIRVEKILPCVRLLFYRGKIERMKCLDNEDDSIKYYAILPLKKNKNNQK
ncbi:uncharacterized protein LOC106868134 [Octopus bimaculoides]|uniref:Ion transport domain-containing protein n=1 Tax=Octopus bimaculoides TaxID=37653 RepID=A0A0L8HWQ1_OCTBM|nr:uncharacterized protein LOC106868134 [Octopus bimaculoides]|eukprot:XP_014768751.1 PREDICTED: uncharacterized protein LOC106868134 [Octopus bimaculoides]